MGIDVYLSWSGMTKKDKENQMVGFSSIHGHVGYLREAYHGGPYATKILVREAFEAKSCKAKISAAVMRERLTHVTEPVLGCDGGHQLAAMFTHVMKMMAEIKGDKEIGIEGGPMASGRTEPMTVEEAVRKRCQTLYSADGVGYEDAVVQSFRDFVALAERKEKETGKPCTVYASY